MRTLVEVLIDEQEAELMVKLRDKVNPLSLDDVQKMRQSDLEVSDQISHSIVMTVCLGPTRRSQ